MNNILEGMFGKGRFIDTRVPARYQGRHTPGLDKIRNYEWLRKNYVYQHKTIETLSKETGVGRGVIRYQLRRYGIEIRPRSAYGRGHHGYGAPGNIKWTKLHDIRWMQTQMNAGRSAQSVAVEIGCGITAVSQVYSVLHKLSCRTCVLNAAA